MPDRRDFDPHVCAMPPTTNNGTERLTVCPWAPTEEIQGVPLCWTHASAVKAGIRPLPNVPPQRAHG